MKRQRMKCKYRTNPANPKRGEWYYKTQWYGVTELVQEPEFWLCYELREQSDWSKKFSEFNPKDAVKTCKSEKTAKKFCEAAENRCYWAYSAADLEIWDQRNKKE
jgi:hypothetical protein